MFSTLLSKLALQTVCCSFLLIACSPDDAEIIEDKSKCNYALYPPIDTVIASHTAWAKENYKKRILDFKVDSIYPNSIVMIGNSLTEQGGDWRLRLGVERKVHNRGIAGDNTDGLRARLGEIICAEPVAVFLMIGTNDLWLSTPESEVASKINAIGNYLADNLKNSKIYVQTIMPLRKDNDRNTRLKNINSSLKTYTQTKYILIDTWAHMADSEGFLPSNFTSDGVHLTQQGYLKWVEILKQNID